MVNSKLRNCERGSIKKRHSLSPLGHFLPLVVFGCDFLPPATNNCIQFTKHVYSCECQNRAIELSFMEGYVVCCPRCTLNLDTAFCLDFMFSKIKSIVHARQLCLNWSVLRRFWERATLLIFKMCLLVPICMIF